MDRGARRRRIASAQTPSWTPVPGPPYEIQGQPGAPAFNSNGTLFAVPSDFGWVYMVSLAEDGKFTVAPFDIGGELRSVAFSPDGRSLAVADYDGGTVSVFSVGAGGALTDRRSFGVGETPLSVAFDPDGQFLAVLNYGTDGGVSTYSVGDGKLISKVPSDQFDNNLAFNSAGTLLAVASSSGKLTTISVDPEGHLSQVTIPPVTTLSNGWVEFSPNGNLLATANAHTVSLFEVRNGVPEEVAPFGHGLAPESLAFSPDGLFLAAANYTQANISLFSVSPGQRRVAAAAQRGSRQPRQAGLIPLPEATISTPHDPFYVLFDPKGRFLVAVYSSSFWGFSIFARSGPLQIRKTAQPRVVTQGGVLRYRLTVHNPNPHPVAAATVTDDLEHVLNQATYQDDARATIGTVTVDTGTSPPGLTWHGTLGAGQTAIIRYSVRVNGDASGFATNRVSGPPGASCLPPSSPEMPCQTETPIVAPPGPGADLSVTKTASTHTTHPGTQVLYTLLVHNHGPLDATGVTVSDPVPPGLFFHTAKPTQGSCTLSAGDLTCRLGRIRSGGSAEVLVEATVATDARGTITNLANVHGRQHDPHPDNNTDSSTINVTPWTEAETTSNLVVAKHGPGTVTQGQRFHYTITVTNKGPDSASDVTLIDGAQLPFRVISIQPSQGHCRTGPSINCALGTIHNGAHVTITVDTIATTAGHQVNSVVVMAPPWDPGPGSNESEAETTIRPAPAPAPPPFTG